MLLHQMLLIHSGKIMFLVQYQIVPSNYSETVLKVDHNWWKYFISRMWSAGQTCSQQSHPQEGRVHTNREWRVSGRRQCGVHLWLWLLSPGFQLQTVWSGRWLVSCDAILWWVVENKTCLLTMRRKTRVYMVLQWDWSSSSLSSRGIIFSPTMLNMILSSGPPAFFFTCLIFLFLGTLVDTTASRADLCFLKYVWKIV